MTNIVKVWWDPENKIGRTAVGGETDVAVAEEIRDKVYALAEEHEGTINWLIDLTQNTKIASSQARKILSGISSYPRFGKLAFFGQNIFIRVALNFIMGAAGKKNTRQFATEAEALAWLKEGK
jgi:hypothetical protein